MALTSRLVWILKWAFRQFVQIFPYFRFIKHITYILFFLISFNGVGQFSDEQQLQIDSLNAVINNSASHDTVKALTYLEIANYYYLQNPDTAIILCKVSQRISEQINFLKGKSESYGWLGYLAGQQGDIAKALEYHHKSLKIHEETGNKEGVASSYNNIGYIHNNQGNIPQALEYFQKSLKIQKEIGDKHGMATLFNNIGMIHQEQGDIPQALEYFHRSLKIKEEIGDKKGMASSYSNIGYIHENQGDIQQALDYYNKSLKIQQEIGDKYGIANSYDHIGYIHKLKGDIAQAMKYYHKSLKIQEEIGDKQGMATSYNNIGGIHSDQGDLSKALEFYQKSLKTREEIGDKHGMAISYNNIGNLKLRVGALEEAENQLTKGLEFAREVGSPEWISANSRNLSKLFKQTNRYQEALEMYELHIQMRDSINSEATLKAAAKQQAKYEYEKVQAVKDKEHEKQLEVEKEAKAKQKVITYATAGGLALVAIFLLFVMNRLKVTRKQKKVIEEQKKVVEEAHQEITDSITYAKRIQSAILPPAKLVAAYLKENFILYKPKDVVAGDFYWMEHKDDKVLFAAADCTGHGVPGAMVSVVCNNALNRSVREHGLTDPGEILTKTRGIVIQEFEKSEEEVKNGMDIALCTLEGNKLQYAGAHNPLWLIRNGELIETKANKQPIGQFDNPEPYTTHSFELQKGDSIYIFSDGFVDQFGGEKGKKFKAKAFRELLLSIQDKSMDEQKTIIDEAFETWRGSLEQIDDVCVIGVRV